MKFSETWLRELIDPPVDANTLADQLTMAGLEVEAVLSCKPLFTDVVVGRVVKMQPHADAGKLKICEVDAGEAGRYTVICGADNVQVGQCYPLVRPGAMLPGGIAVQTTVIRGTESQGMLCSELELGLSENAAGIFELAEDARPGQDLAEYLALDDNLIDISLTPNRGDCLSLWGIAREVAVLNNLHFTAEKPAAVTTEIESARGIRLSAPAACPRYCGRIIEGIDLTKTAPILVRERLRRSGLRSINAVVDLGNYVMLESGQPMHVFDNEKLHGVIDVRYANPGEKLELLDGTVQELNDDTLLICDDSVPVAMAGIMGGLSTAVSLQTRSIFIESAFFHPQAIMGRSRRYGLQTDASYRYERGVDPALCHKALQRLSELIIQVCGGRAGPVSEMVDEEYLPASETILLRRERISRLLGIAVPAGHISRILEQLGFQVNIVQDGWEVRVPSHRFDIGLEADLIEEIARIYGYESIPGNAPVSTMQCRALQPLAALQQQMAQTLLARDYHEAITYSFVNPDRQQQLLGGPHGIRLLNPISSDLSVMRRSLWPGLLEALRYNIHRQQYRVRLFESGQVFTMHNGSEEVPCIAGIISGNIYPEQWGIAKKLCDFYDMKGDVEALLSLSPGLDQLVFQPAQHPALHPGQAAEIVYAERSIGLIGCLHPALQADWDLTDTVCLFELDLSLISVKKHENYRKISKYPTIRRDISIIVGEQTDAIQVIETVKTASSEPLQNLELFDVYQGEGIDSGKKSLALGLTFQRSSSTLTDEEADAAVGGILNSLHEQFGAILRE